MLTISRCLIIFAALILFYCLSVWAVKYFYYINKLPQELGVYGIVYQNDRAMGFGPGANESGLVVYALSHEVSNKIQNERLGFLSTIIVNKLSKHPRSKPKWQETPLIPSRHWVDYMSLSGDVDYSNEKLSISHFLNAHGMGFEVPKGIIEMIDDALTSKGNFYASKKHGEIIILIPEKNRVIFAYSG